MNKKYIYLLPVLLLLASSFALKPKKLLKVFKLINKEVTANGQAYQSLGDICKNIGHRLTGSKNGNLAEEHVFNLLKSYGYTDLDYMPFEVKAWSRNKVSLSLVPDQSDNYQTVEVVALAHSPVSSHINAQIIDCNDGLETDFETIGETLKGKIALFNINVQSDINKGKANLHRSEKTALAISHGAAGVIIANAVKGGVLLTGTASVTGKLIPIPAVCISLENGIKIREWIAAEKNILGVIDMQNYSRPIKARNIIATHKASKDNKETILVGAHLDSWDLAQGAIDNGIGAFSVIEVARIFKKLNLKTKRNIEFVLFMGEEQGLLGSQFLVDNYKKNNKLDHIKLAMNLDMVNNAQGFNSYGSDKLKDYVNTKADLIELADNNFKNFNISRASLHSDHQSFMLQGVPVLSPFGNFPIKSINCYHANCDDFDLIKETDINNNVKYTAMLLYALANESEFPVSNLSDLETKEFLEQQGLKEALILGNDWRW